MKKNKTIFIFSMPKSGSTLLQRMVATSERVSTLPETWLLLPLFYMLKKDGIYSEFSGRQLSKAIRGNIIDSGKEYVYMKEVAKFYESLIHQLCGNTDAEYFLEKTPRYNLIFNEIISTFKDSRFLVLTRNPLMIMMSMMNTYSNGYYNLYRFSIDLKEGFSCISAMLAKNDSRVIHVKYEDLIEQPEIVIRKIGEHLGIDLVTSWNDFSNIDVSGFVGDPVGSKTYSVISKNNLHFKDMKLNVLRKIILIRHLNKMGADDLSIQGYDYDELIGSVKDSKFTINYLVSDLVLLMFGTLFCFFDFVPLAGKIKSKRYFPVW